MSKRSIGKKRVRSLSSKIRAVIFISVLCCVGLIGWFTYFIGKSELEMSLKDSLEMIVSTGSVFLNGNTHQSITSVDSDAYRELRSILLRIKKSSGLEAPLYTLKRSEGRNEVVCVITTEPMNLLGATYKMREEMHAVFRKGVTTSSNFYETPAGIWISAYSPIKNDLGQVVAMLKAQRHVGFISVILQARIFTISFFCLISLAIGLLLSFFLIKQTTLNIETLDSAAQKLGSGDYATKISIKSNDEIGRLANTLDKLRTSLQDKIKEVQAMLLSEKKAHLESILTLSKAIEIRDPYTRGHIERVSHYSMLIAKKLEIEDDKIEKLRYGCILHDLGKLDINIDILEKPAALDYDEKIKLKMHTIYGAEILKGIDFFDSAREISLYHHERYDGKGYPYGLKGENIPIFARIVSLADAFDAMVTDRPYRKKLSVEETFRIIASEAGKQFDPKICYVFLETKKEILIIRNRYK